jgi:LPXTG-motif cell wall-anchored protein
MTNLRRIATAAVATAVVTAVMATTPANAQTTGSGLFGKQDASFDGVYRQSLALLALEAVGRTPDSLAISWLQKQQCSDGTFTSYLKVTGTACAANAKDSNATGLALQAQAALGLSTTKTLAGMKTFQDSDGGFYSNKLFSSSPGSDANSTGIALAALDAANVDPTTVTSGGKNGRDFLRTVQIACSGAAGDRGAYDYQTESPLLANNFASAQATEGALGAALPVAHKSGSTAQPAMTCPGGPASDAEAAQDAAGYLARTLQANSGLIPSAFGGGTDYTSTANAVVSLVAAGVGSTQVTQALNALAAHVNAYVRDAKGVDQPAALAWLILAAHAGGRDATSFGGINLVSRLQATEDSRTVAPKPSPSPTATPTASPTPSVAANNATLPATGGHDVTPIALIGALALAAGGAFVAAGRRP